MGDYRKRIGRIESMIQLDREAVTEADNCAACAWYADALEALDSGEELAPIDAAIWNDIFENGMDGVKAWKKWQTTNGGLTA